METQTLEMTAENILTLIERLPSNERVRLNQLMTQPHVEPVKPKPPRDKRVPSQPMPDDTREMEWIEQHKHEYAGQWVALDGDRLIAASSIQQDVWSAVKADGAKLPLVHRISSPDDLPYIGI